MRVSSGRAVIDFCGKMRIYSRPSPRMYCCAAIRPDSIVWALIHPPWVACKPKSPKTTRLPRWASPFIRPLWLFRCFTRLGISAIGFNSVHTLVHPHLNTNVPLSSPGLSETIIDLRSQCRKRQRARRRLLAPRHLRPAQAARKLDLDSLCARVHRRLDGSLDCPAKTRPLGKLLADIL